jgi:uncharacterized membrane protein YhhN
MAVTLTALCLLFLVGLLVSEVKASTKLRYITKPLASAAFVLLAVVLADWQGDDNSYALYILVGLVFGAGGDVALMFTGQRAFLAGLVSFLIGHVAYVVACAAIVAPSAWPSLHAIAPVVAALAVLVYLWPHLGSMLVPVLAYVATIVLMVVGAIAVYFGHPESFSDQQAILLLVGAVLFFVSDISVAKGRFVKALVRDRLWGLPAYYGGQLLIAWSLSVS